MIKSLQKIPLLLSLLSFNGLAESTGLLTIRFAGMASDTGTLVAALVDSKDRFLAKNKPALHSYLGKIQQQQSVWVIQSLPFGYYAISAYHDKNNNGKLDTGLFGIPSEDYGFSNNTRGSFGPPDYIDAKFEFKQTGQIVNIWIK